MWTTGLHRRHKHHHHPPHRQHSYTSDWTKVRKKSPSEEDWVIAGIAGLGIFDRCKSQPMNLSAQHPRFLRYKPSEILANARRTKHRYAAFGSVRPNGEEDENEQVDKKVIEVAEEQTSESSATAASAAPEPALFVSETDKEEVETIERQAIAQDLIERQLDPSQENIDSTIADTKEATREIEPETKSLQSFIDEAGRLLLALRSDAESGRLPEHIRVSYEAMARELLRIRTPSGLQEALDILDSVERKSSGASAASAFGGGGASAASAMGGVVERGAPSSVVPSPNLPQSSAEETRLSFRAFLKSLSQEARRVSRDVSSRVSRGASAFRRSLTPLFTRKRPRGASSPTAEELAFRAPERVVDVPEEFDIEKGLRLQKRRRRTIPLGESEALQERITLLEEETEAAAQSAPATRAQHVAIEALRTARAALDLAEVNERRASLAASMVEHHTTGFITQVRQLAGQTALEAVGFNSLLETRDITSLLYIPLFRFFERVALHYLVFRVPNVWQRFIDWLYRQPKLRWVARFLDRITSPFLTASPPPAYVYNLLDVFFVQNPDMMKFMIRLVGYELLLQNIDKFVASL